MTKESVNQFMRELKKRNKYEKLFLQAVGESAYWLIPFINENYIYSNKKIMERITEPERIIIFRVPWLDDKGNIQINRGFRIEMNSSIGPYKGGLRFHPTVNLDMLKFLAYEQTFKNSLTSLPLGSGKGGANFDPKGKSDNEVMKFCQSFMTELFRHIGHHTDIPAGDIGVGSREIGYLYGQYKRIRNEFTGVFTGKSIDLGGSYIRPEATGYGNAYFTQEMLKLRGESFKGKKVLISGSGNVAQFTAEKVIELGGKVITMSDSNGFIYDKDGIDYEKLNHIKELKNIKRARISEYTKRYNAEYYEDIKPWGVKADIALPSATQNEIIEEDAVKLLKNGCYCVSEGANMPCSNDAVKLFTQNKILYSPGKASNAGGVAISGLEMSQNSLRMQWPREEVDEKLQTIMKSIHKRCVKYGQIDNDYINYNKGATIGGFIKIANAMLAAGNV